MARDAAAGNGATCLLDSEAAKCLDEEQEEEQRLLPRDSVAELGQCERYRLVAKVAVEQPHSGPAALAAHYALIGAIMLSILAVVAETMPELEGFWWMFLVFEKIVTFVFTAEILVRIWVADDRCAYLCSWSNTIDLVATLPWYLEQAIRLMDVERPNIDELVFDPFAMMRKGFEDSFWTLRMIRMLQMIRLMRVLRLAKATRHSETMTSVLNSAQASLNGLSALVSFVTMGTLLSATVVFFLESQEEHTDFESIPAALWWALATVTAVGYGDMVPETVPGKVAACFTMVAGVLIVSLSAAITTNSFVEHYQRNVQRLRVVKAQQRLTQGRRGSLPLGATDGVVRRSSWQLIESSELLEGDEGSLTECFQELEEGVMKVMACLESMAARVNAAGSAEQALGKEGKPLCSPALECSVTSVQLLQEQSKTWFRLTRKFSKHVLEREAGREAGT